MCDIAKRPGYEPPKVLYWPGHDNTTCTGSGTPLGDDYKNIEPCPHHHHCSIGSIAISPLLYLQINLKDSPYKTTQISNWAGEFSTIFNKYQTEFPYLNVRNITGLSSHWNPRYGKDWDDFRYKACSGQFTDPNIYGVWSPGSSACSTFMTQQYCPTRMGLRGCQDYCRQYSNPHCDDAAYKYCNDRKRTKDPDFCSCINSSLPNPYCLDPNCKLEGYQPTNVRSKPCNITEIDCTQIIDAQGNSNSSFKDISQYQVCEAGTCDVAKGDTCIKGKSSNNNKGWQFLEENLMLFMVICFILAIISAFVLKHSEDGRL